MISLGPGKTTPVEVTLSVHCVEGLMCRLDAWQKREWNHVQRLAEMLHRLTSASPLMTMIVTRRRDSKEM